MRSVRWDGRAPTSASYWTRLPIRPTILFVILAFVASYALAFALMALGANAWLVQTGAVLGPTIAAMAALRLEKRSIREFLAQRLFSDAPNWRFLAIVVVMVALSVPSLILAGGSIDGFIHAWSRPETYGVLAFNIFVVALFEELGWRGYLTPRLLERMTPFAVSLIVGVIWALWHGPKLLALPMLGVVAIALSFPMTFLVATRKAGLAGCILLHGSFNAAVMALEKSVGFETALATFNIMAGGMMVLALGLVASRRDWFFGKQAGQETARPASP